MAKHEFDVSEEKSSERKGSGGLYCSTGQVVATAVTICLLMAAMALLMYYIPDRTDKKVRVSDKPNVIVPVTETVEDTTAAISPMVTTYRPTPLTMTTTADEVFPATTGQPSDLMEGRLPTTVLPRRYEVNLRPFLYEEDVASSKMGERFTFDGRVHVVVECMQPTDEITLHCKNITIHGMPTVRLAGRSTGEDIFQSYQMVEEYAFLVLKLKEKMILHEEYDIFIDYSGIMADEEAGFYPSMYVDSLNNTRYIATTQMEGPHARRVWPCFDEPAFKASYDVQLEHRRDMSALSNGIATRTFNLDNKWSRTYFKRVPSMSSYLLAFIVHDFSSINVTNANGCLIRVWAETELINLASYALNVSNKVQTFFDEYLDNEYPLDKQDHIAIQQFHGAMENWGLITYRDIMLLRGMEDINNTFYSELIAHELAHQWFGNLVTMEWWDDLWLNEGFATYMEHIGVNFVHPEFRMIEHFYFDITAPVLYMDGLGSLPSLRSPVYATDEDIGMSFSVITYFKGGALIRMMENFLTTAIFNHGIRNYLKERSYKNANADHLWAELTEADKDAGKHDVKKIMDTWSLQPGYPLISLARTRNTIVATQQRFLISNLTESIGYRWHVPLTYVYKSGPADQFDKPGTLWMDPAEQYTIFSLPEAAFSTDWYLVNAEMTGYYRVNYDEENWQRLLEQAATDPNVFSENNKMGLLEDAYYLAFAGLVPNSLYHNLSVLLIESNSRSARHVVLSLASYYERMLDDDSGKFRRRRGAFSSVKTYMRQLVDPLYEESGWNASSASAVTITSDHGRRENSLDVTSTACRCGNSDCVSKATALFKEVMNESGINTIHEYMRPAVYCNGIRYGGQAEWDFAWSVSITTTNRRERSKWIRALSCSRDANLLESYLQSVFDPRGPYNRHDVETVLMGVSESPVGYKVAWNFLRSNWEQVYATFKRNGKSLCDIFLKITSYFNTQQQMEDLLEFGRGRRIGLLKYAYQTAIITTEINIRWMAKSSEETQQWITSRIKQSVIQNN